MASPFPIAAHREGAPALGGKRRGRLALILAICFASAQSGCVERRMTVRTNPPGALVYVDDYEVGITPVSTSFIYYGNRKIRLVKDGYETLTVIQPVPPPWYEIPPGDFVSENLVPGKLRDQRVFDFQLRPQAVIPKEELLGRAEALRQGSQVARLGANGLATPGVRVNVPSPDPGAYASPSLGAQSIYQLPPGGPPPAPGAQPPLYQIPTGPASAVPAYQPQPSYQPQPGAYGPSVGGQPTYQLPPSSPSDGR